MSISMSRLSSGTKAKTKTVTFQLSSKVVIVLYMAMVLLHKPHYNKIIPFFL